MNEDIEKKLDQLLADMPKREYDLDAWLAEDETAEFDRIVSKRRPLWRWVAAAACFLLIIGVGLHYQFEEPVVTSDVTSGNTAQYIKPQAPLPKVTPESTPEPAPEPTPKPVQKRRTERTNMPDKQRTPGVQTVTPQESASMVTDPNLHYAALTESDDTVKYQAPSRVDDFIAKLADYNKVKQGELTCSQPIDSSVVSRVYVFPDKKEIDVFGRLLQVACSYSDATPGYHLYFSHQQFFFELQDVRKQLQYRWIAERVNGKILLYSTNAPLGVNTSSVCYQEYRDELMNTKIINTKSKEI